MDLAWMPTFTMRENTAMEVNRLTDTNYQWNEENLFSSTSLRWLNDGDVKELQAYLNIITNSPCAISTISQVVKH